MRLDGTAGSRPVRACVAAVLAVGTLVAGGATALANPDTTDTTHTAPADPAAPSTDTLPISVAITAVTPQILQPGEDLTLTATLRNDGDEAIEAPHASVRIYRYRLSSREQLTSWAAGGTRSPIGDVAATTLLETPLEPGATATVQVQVPADAVGLLRTDDAWGPRGITLDVGDGSRRIGIDRTFLLWSSSADVPTAHVGVLSSVVGPAADPAVTPAGDLTDDEEGAGEPGPTPSATPDPTATSTPDAAATPDDGELTALTAAGGRLTRLLQSTVDFPFVSWAVDPALVESASTGSRAAQTWLTGLTDAATGREVLRLPWADPDLTAIAHAGSGGAASTDLLDLARGVTGSVEDSPLWTTAQPVLWSADDTPDQITAERVATSGGGAPLVVGPEALASDARIPSSPATVETSAGDVVALVPDQTLSTLLAGPASVESAPTPATAAQRMLAETAVLARSDDAAGTYVLATTARNWEPSTALVTAQLTALRDAPWVDTATVADMLAGRAAGDGSDRADLPQFERSGAELTPAWVNAISAEWRAASEFAAVVADPDALLEGLDGDLLAPLAVAWRDDPDGRTAAVNAALAESKAHQTGLSVLLNEQFTVISSSAQVSVTVRNDLDQDATVRVELRPQKGCLDTARSQPVDVAANAETPVKLTLRATANCDVQVDASLVSETGRVLADPATFSARVAPTIESVGSIVIGVLLALALAFGIWRTVKRGQTSRRGARVAPDAEATDPDAAVRPDLPDGPDDSGEPAAATGRPTDVGDRQDRP